MNSCKHPPTRLYSGLSFNCVTEKQDWLWVGCLNCHKILKGDEESFKNYLKENGFELED